MRSTLPDARWPTWVSPPATMRTTGTWILSTPTFADDYDVIFNNDGTGNFTDVSYAAGIAETTIPFVGFGDGFLDYDNDGWKDLLIVNGHVYPEVDQHPEWGTTYAAALATVS